MSATRQRWLRELTHDGWETKPAPDIDGNRLIAAEIDGNFLSTKSYHGIETAGAITMTGATLTIAGPIKYWYKGNYHESATDISVTVATPQANTIYYIMFTDASGVLEANATAWNLRTDVPVATAYFDGAATNAAVVKETHNHTRNIDWHINAHLTIGARYESGLNLAAPIDSGNQGTLSIGAGVIYDEDIRINILSQSNARLWRQASAGVYTWLDIDRGYPGTLNAPQYLRTSDWTMQAVGGTNFACYWVYASGDINRPIYVVPTQAGNPHNTVAIARGETPPILAGMGLSSELKLIFRLIYKGDGAFQESTDYRTSSSLPSGFVSSTTAAAVTFEPAGDVTSTDVQSAIEELDFVKEPHLAEPMVDGYVLSSTTAGVRSWVEMTGGGGSGITAAEAKKIAIIFG